MQIIAMKAVYSEELRYGKVVSKFQSSKIEKAKAKLVIPLSCM
jgi:hypothetical protein